MKVSFCLLPFMILWATVSSAQTIGFDYSNIGNEQIQFIGTGDQLIFASNVNDHGFRITNSGQSGLVGLMGAIDGAFTIGAITPLTGGFEQAPVTGTGTFKVFESGTSTVALTADVSWGDVIKVGPAGILNPNAVLNLSNFHYAGSYDPLNALGNSTSGTTVVTFQFFPPVTLEQLTADGTTHTASYSGSTTTNGLIVPIPEPSTSALFLSGAVLFGVFLLRRKQVLT